MTRVNPLIARDPRLHGMAGPDRLRTRVKPLAVGISERDFQNIIVELAGWCGWLISHQRASIVRRGKDGAPDQWATATQGHTGFPDLVLVHEQRGLCLFRELKVGANQLQQPQKAWGAALKAAGADWAVWRETEWLVTVAPTLIG